MSALASRELTEDALAEAIAEMASAHGRAGMILVVGSRANLRAQRIVRSPGGPLYEIVSVVVDPKADEDHWSLVVVPKRQAQRRRS